MPCAFSDTQIHIGGCTLNTGNLLESSTNQRYRRQSYVTLLRPTKAMYELKLNKKEKRFFFCKSERGLSSFPFVVSMSKRWFVFTKKQYDFCPRCAAYFILYVFFSSRLSPRFGFYRRMTQHFFLLNNLEHGFLEREFSTLS